MFATIAVLLVVGLAVILGRGSSEPAVKGKTITGAVELRSLRGVNWYDGQTTEGSWCAGRPASGYSDLGQNAQVLILNESGATIGTASLGKGSLGPVVAVCR